MGCFDHLSVSDFRAAGSSFPSSPSVVCVCVCVGVSE